jgi:putative transposase
MPRANRYFRYFPAGYPWHITHRCHNRSFLLSAARDRKCWRQWLAEARKRFDLRILNYCVTCNHIHLLIMGLEDPYQVSRSMQLIAGKTAEEYNRRKARKGAFWEDRYHATVVDTGKYFERCMTYIDLNMVRAGVVANPSSWLDCGFRELTMTRVRGPLIDRASLAHLSGIEKISDLKMIRSNAVENALSFESRARDERWSRSVAIGSEGFIANLERTFAARMGKVKLSLSSVEEPHTPFGRKNDDQIFHLSDSNWVYL